MSYEIVRLVALRVHCVRALLSHRNLSNATVHYAFECAIIATATTITATAAAAAAVRTGHCSVNIASIIRRSAREYRPI